MLSKGKILGGIAAGVIALGAGGALVKIKNTIEKENYKIELIEDSLPPAPESITNPNALTTTPTDVPVFMNTAAIEDWIYKAGIEKMPTNGKIYVCSGYGCLYKTPYRFTDEVIDKIKAIFDINDAPNDAEIERSNILQALNLIKLEVGKATGTDADTPGDSFFANGQREQMSNYDETVNTLEYLVVLSQLKFIRNHHLNGPESSTWDLSTVNSITDARTKQIFIIGLNNRGEYVLIERQ